MIFIYLATYDSLLGILEKGRNASTTYHNPTAAKCYGRKLAVNVSDIANALTKALSFIRCLSLAF